MGLKLTTQEGYDFDLLTQFVQLFPSSALTSLISGYFAYTGMQIGKDEKDDLDTGDSVVTLDREVGFEMILVGAPHINCHRI